MKLENKLYLFKYAETKDRIKLLSKAKNFTDLRKNIIGNTTRNNQFLLLITFTKNILYKPRTNPNTKPLIVKFSLIYFKDHKFIYPGIERQAEISNDFIKSKGLTDETISKIAHTTLKQLKYDAPKLLKYTPDNPHNVVLPFDEYDFDMTPDINPHNVELPFDEYDFDMTPDVNPHNVELPFDEYDFDMSFNEFNKPKPIKKNIQKLLLEMEATDFKVKGIRKPSQFKKIENKMAVIKEIKKNKTKRDIEDLLNKMEDTDFKVKGIRKPSQFKKIENKMAVIKEIKKNKTKRDIEDLLNKMEDTDFKVKGIKKPSQFKKIEDAIYNKKISKNNNLKGNIQALLNDIQNTEMPLIKKLSKPKQFKKIEDLFKKVKSDKKELDKLDKTMSLEDLNKIRLAYLNDLKELQTELNDYKDLDEYAELQNSYDKDDDKALSYFDKMKKSMSQPNDMKEPDTDIIENFKKAMSQPKDKKEPDTDIFEECKKVIDDKLNEDLAIYDKLFEENRQFMAENIIEEIVKIKDDYYFVIKKNFRNELKKNEIQYIKIPKKPSYLRKIDKKWYINDMINMKLTEQKKLEKSEIGDPESIIKRRKEGGWEIRSKITDYKAIADKLKNEIEDITKVPSQNELNRTVERVVKQLETSQNGLNRTGVRISV